MATGCNGSHLEYKFMPHGNITTPVFRNLLPEYVNNDIKYFTLTAGIVLSIGSILSLKNTPSCLLDLCICIIT